MKGQLTSTPIFTLPSRNGGFIIFSDAFYQGSRCVLMQYGKIIAYASRKLKPYELKYLTHYLELIAIFFCAKDKERDYLLGEK